VLAFGEHALELLVVERSGVSEAAVGRLDAELLSGEAVLCRSAQRWISFPSGIVLLYREVETIEPLNRR
jgi:hypothetical protein